MVDTALALAGSGVFYLFILEWNGWDGVIGCIRGDGLGWDMVLFSGGGGAAVRV